MNNDNDDNYFDNVDNDAVDGNHYFDKYDNDDNNILSRPTMSSLIGRDQNQVLYVQEVLSIFIYGALYEYGQNFWDT